MLAKGQVVFPEEGDDGEGFLLGYIFENASLWLGWAKSYYEERAAKIEADWIKKVYERNVTEEIIQMINSDRDIKGAMKELKEIGYRGWFKYITINFFGKATEIALMVKGDQDGKFDEEQYAAYNGLMQNWEQLQQSFLQPILDYYKQKRHELGYDIEFNENYPLIEAIDQLLEKITLVGIIVSYAGCFEGRDIGITFDCTWDSENGLGLRLVNEKVIEVGYQDVAI